MIDLYLYFINFRIDAKMTGNFQGGLAQMVERALSMREVLGSMPRSSTPFLSLLLVFSPQFDSEDMFYV